MQAYSLTDLAQAPLDLGPLANPLDAGDPR
jgi:hypothetical protein